MHLPGSRSHFRAPARKVSPWRINPAGASFLLPARSRNHQHTGVGAASYSGAHPNPTAPTPAATGSDCKTGGAAVLGLSRPQAAASVCAAGGEKRLPTANEMDGRVSSRGGRGLTERCSNAASGNALITRQADPTVRPPSVSADDYWLAAREVERMGLPKSAQCAGDEVGK